MGLKLITPPSVFPISLVDAKAHLNIMESTDDTYIQSLIEVATAQAEDITSRQLMSATYELRMDCMLDEFEVPKPPLQSVTRIEYLDLEGVTQILDSSLYSFDELASPAVIYKKTDDAYPPMLNQRDSVKVTFVAGYTDNVPTPIKQWIKIRVSTLYENREDVSQGIQSYAVPDQYSSFLLGKYKVVYL